jgi:uncharacterized membrane protein HdeD (DUF308 family)
MTVRKMTVNDRIRALPWWAFLLVGLASLALGALLVISPQAAITNIFRIVGLLGILGGAAAIISILFSRRSWGWKLFGGILGLLIGLVLLASPLGTAYLAAAIVVWVVATAAILAGVGLIIWGVANALWEYTVLGILALGLGALLILTIAVGSLVVPWLFGIVAIIGGGAIIWDAFRMRSGKHAGVRSA